MTTGSKRLEVRSSWQMRFLGTLGGWIARVVSWTIRMKVEDRCGVTSKDGCERPMIWCIWHNRILGLTMTRRLFPWRQGVVLTSASHDGAVLAAAAKVFGAGSVRGSSSRRGSAALKELVRALKGGLDVGITPDGPRGPRYKISAGVIKLAQVAQAPVMGFHLRFSRAIRLKTWDRFVIPLPFSRITVVFDEVLDVPRELDEDGLEDKRRVLEERMRNTVDDLELPAYEHHKRKRSRR